MLAEDNFLHKISLNIMLNVSQKYAGYNFFFKHRIIQVNVEAKKLKR